MMKIKVCGLTRITDIQLCLRLGVDYLGVITEISRSPRCQSFTLARRLFACMQGKGVAVVENPDETLLQELAQVAWLHAVQLHNVTDACQVIWLRKFLPEQINIWAALAIPTTKENNLHSTDNIVQLAGECLEAGAQMLVVDAAVGGQSGGTGQVADLEIVRRVVEIAPQQVLVAGGIRPDNACEILRESGATGVDVSSGVERLPGVKDALKIRDLMQNLS